MWNDLQESVIVATSVVESESMLDKFGKEQEQNLIIKHKVCPPYIIIMN